MRDGLDGLTDREKETLRLLLAGHDAKSIARHFDLSVHTVNERLRDARRKLGVPSSREAARLLAESEPDTPNNLTDKQIGVARQGGNVRYFRPADRPQVAGARLIWLAGGMLIMSLIIAVVALSSAFQASPVAATQSAPVQTAATKPLPPTDPAGIRAARDWIALIDKQRWDESWNRAAVMFQTQIAAAQWKITIQSVRQPLGSVSSRVMQNAVRTSTLPGAPAGDYEVVQFLTNFAGKSSAIETAFLVREGSAWKMAGYFIR